ncbi:hypothetical protein N0V94_003373 [Neodidymelliopsis sp. IMI 364377]|nr:hypothetical protein N0V94_003373 [Neodidymelliopsis sp. IMI 364377]
MTENVSNRYLTPSSGSPFMKLPEHTKGFVDTQTLKDIHECLSQSEQGDDIALAAWLKEHYLQEPLIEEGRPIRNTEGFVKLDTAYRRVRQLTGKAQDKWPFFDRSWKKMSSTAIKKLALEDTAMDMNHPVANGKIHDSPMCNGVDSQHAPDASSASLAGSTLSDDISVLKSAVHGTAAPADSLWDAEADKVRGTQGRSVNKKKSGPNIKYVKKSRSKSAFDSASEEDIHSTDEVVVDTSAHGSVTSVSSNSLSGQATPELTKDTQMLGTSLNYSPTSSVLAAEAEAVPSNLDRLPPRSTSKKRKSDSEVQRGGNKRGRGSRGGILGRPRKSEPVPVNVEPAISEITEVEPVPSQPEPEVKATRRSTRKSTVPVLEQQQPTEVASDIPANTSGDELDGVRSTDGDLIGKKAAFPIQQVIQVESQRAMRKDLPKALGTTPGTRNTKTQKTPNSSKRKKRVSFSPTLDASNVELFARIKTNTGIQDIPISKEDIKSEVLLIERYAAWQDAEATNVTFETFKQIAKFAQ